MVSMELLREFQTLGCDDETKRAIAYRVYIDLIDVVGLARIERFYDQELDELYFCGYEESESSEKVDIYLPTSSYGHLNFLHIDNVQKKFCQGQQKSIVLCICDASSTIVYYRLTQGFQEMDKQIPQTT